MQQKFVAMGTYAIATPTWRLLCSSFLVMTCALIVMGYNMLPKKELQRRSLQVRLAATETRSPQGPGRELFEPATCHGRINSKGPNSEGQSDNCSELWAPDSCQK